MALLISYFSFLCLPKHCFLVYLVVSHVFISNEKEAKENPENCVNLNLVPHVFNVS